MRTRCRSSVLALLCALVAAALLTAPAVAQTTAETARPADAFVDSIGVNVRLHHQGTVYDTGFSSIIAPKLAALGVRHVRDNAYTYAAANAGTFFYARCRALAATGIRFNLVTGIASTAGPATDLSKLDDMYSWCGGGVEAFEGANEPDLATLAAGSTAWNTQTANLQRNLWAEVKGNPAIRHLAVIGPSPTWNPEQVGDLSGAMDFGNWHPYPGGNCPTCGDVYGTNVDDLAARYMSPSGPRPLIATETGYHNAVNSTSTEHRPVTELAAGKYIPRLLLEYFNRGFARTYLYELIDATADSTRTSGDANFGLLRNNGGEKPAFRAVKSTIDLLRDPGPGFSPGSLRYALSGATDGVHHTLLQKRNGAFYLALWQERPSYDTGARANAADNRAARRDLAVPDQGVRISLGSPMAGATMYQLLPDGRMASAPLAINGGAIDAPVADRVTFIELTPPAAAASNAAPVLSRVRLRHRAFAPVPRRRAKSRSADARAAVRTAKARRKRAPRGTAFRYTLSEPATVHITVDRRTRGRRVGRGSKRRCAAGRPRRASQRCVRYRKVGSFSVSAAAGRRSSAFSGRLRGKALRRGRYRGRVVAVDAAGARSKQRIVHFRVVRR